MLQVSAGLSGDSGHCSAVHSDRVEVEVERGGVLVFAPQVVVEADNPHRDNNTIVDSSVLMLRSSYYLPKSFLAVPGPSSRHVSRERERPTIYLKRSSHHHLSVDNIIIIIIIIMREEAMLRYHPSPSTARGDRGAATSSSMMVAGPCLCALSVCLSVCLRVRRSQTNIIHTHAHHHHSRTHYRQWHIILISSIITNNHPSNY